MLTPGQGRPADSRFNLWEGYHGSPWQGFAPAICAANGMNAGVERSHKKNEHKD
jgi:hypothetical protein